jgi:hypothetical protein
MSGVNITGTSDGFVHAVSPIGGSEHTICGIAADAAASEGDEALRWVHPKTQYVTCAECYRVVKFCWGIKVAKSLGSNALRSDHPLAPGRCAHGINMNVHCSECFDHPAKAIDQQGGAA